jgi:hypothetical protein
MALSKRLLAVLCVSLALAGCSDDSLSPDTVNPLTLADDADNVTAVFNNAGFQSMTALAAHFPSFGAAIVLEASANALQGNLVSSSLRSPADIQDLFPADVLGKTFEWDTETDEYVVGTVPGAPANGIRVLIYSVNPVSGMPVEPLQELGFVELTDEGTAQYAQVGILLRILGNTFADYSVRQVQNLASDVYTAQGRINSADLQRHIDFSMTYTVNLGGVQTLAMDVAGSEGTVIGLDITRMASEDAIDFSVGRGGNTVSFEGTLTTTTVDADIKFNGTTVASITGNRDDPAITVSEGFSLTPAQLVALGQIFEAASQFLDDLFEGIFGPAFNIFA